MRLAARPSRADDVAASGVGGATVLCLDAEAGWTSAPGGVVLIDIAPDRPFA